MTLIDRTDLQIRELRELRARLTVTSERAHGSYRQAELDDAGRNLQFAEMATRLAECERLWRLPR